MSLLDPARRLKRFVLPSGPALRRLPTGIGRGLTLEIDFAHQTLLYAGLYEIELHASLRRLCTPGTTSYDIGAHDGYESLLLAKLGRAPVLAVEFDEHLCEKMRTNFAANPDLAPLLSIRQAYVSSADDERAGSVTVDELAAAPGAFLPKLVKIDVEGGEAAVLRGAEVVLREARPHVIVETHSAELEAECAELLHERGYRPRVVRQRRWLPDRRLLPHNRWLVAAGRL
jgi:hypothetical protein